MKCVNGDYAPAPLLRLDEIPGGETVTVRHGPQGTPGCGTLLFAPQIRSNLDCTLCLRLRARLPAREHRPHGASTWPRTAAAWRLAAASGCLATGHPAGGHGSYQRLRHGAAGLCAAAISGGELRPAQRIAHPVAGFRRDQPAAANLAHAAGGGPGPLAERHGRASTACAPRWPFSRRLSCRWGSACGSRTTPFTFSSPPAASSPCCRSFSARAATGDASAAAWTATLIGLVQLGAIGGGSVWSLLIAQRGGDAHVPARRRSRYAPLGAAAAGNCVGCRLDLQPADGDAWLDSVFLIFLAGPPAESCHERHQRAHRQFGTFTHCKAYQDTHVQTPNFSPLR